MKEQNRLRLERLTTRYAKRLVEQQNPQEADFLREFDELRTRLLRPLMEEMADELRKAGHEPRVVCDQGQDNPSIELLLGLKGGKGTSNLVGFSVIRWENYPLQILAYLVVNPPKFDLQRFARAADVTVESAEQMLVDGIEHVITCNAP